jgi:hypothetical protein
MVREKRAEEEDIDKMVREVLDAQTKKNSSDVIEYRD